MEEPTGLYIGQQENELEFKVSSIQLIGYRGFELEEFELSDLTVFVGINGSGKSTALQALALLLEDIVRRIGTKARKGNAPIFFDFREKQSTLLLTGELKWAGFQYRFSRRWNKFNRSVSETRLRIQDIEKHPTLLLTLKYSSEPPETIPILGFYPVARAVDKVPLRIRASETLSRLSGYDLAFTGDRTFISFFEWFRNQEDVENEVIRETRNPDYRDPKLNAVRSAIEQALPGYQNLKVVRKPRLLMKVSKGKESLAIQQLSDGERGALSLIGDIAKRMALLNPHLDNPLLSPGCILIDEVDQHLHPQWQRKIVSTLRSIFPNVQFVLATHSPIVCGSVESANILILENGTARSASTYGWTMKTILQEVFGINERPDEIADLIRALDERIDHQDVVGAKQTLNELKKTLPSDDPEVIRADVILPLLKHSEETSERD